jgi:hypothetical protein
MNNDSAIEVSKIICPNCNKLIPLHIRIDDLKIIHHKRPKKFNQERPCNLCYKIYSTEVSCISSKGHIFTAQYACTDPVSVQV